MDLVQVGTSRGGAELAAALCQALPRSAAFWLAGQLAATLAARQDLPMTSALLSNLGIVLGLPQDHPEVRAAVRRLYANQFCSYVDLFAIRSGGVEEIQAMVLLDPGVMQAVSQPPRSGHGVLFVGCHTCGFDLLLLALQQRIPDLQALTHRHPVGGMQIMNQLRQGFGLRVTPISAGSLREAVEHLKQGGVVGMAADLPDRRGLPVRFFGRECYLPTGPARLALASGARMVVGRASRLGNGRYRGQGELCEAPDSEGTRADRAARWTERCLQLVEGYIRQSPDQWFVPYPVWEGQPEVEPAVGRLTGQVIQG